MSEKKVKIYVCNGKSCKTAQTDLKLKTWLKKYFTDDEIGEINCLGRCNDTFSLLYKGIVYTVFSPAYLNKIIKLKEYGNL